MRLFFASLFVSVLAFGAFLLAPQSTHALSCVAPEPSSAFIANGGVIFEGIVTSNTATSVQSDGAQTRKVVFSVSRAWSPEGRIHTPFTITDSVPASTSSLPSLVPAGATGVVPFSADDPWGFRLTFEVGKKYIVFASFDGVYRADIGGCARSHEANDQAMQNLIAELGNPYIPGSSANPTPSQPTFQDTLLKRIQELLALVADLQARLTKVESDGGSTGSTVADFEDCVAKTGTVLESFPRQCVYGGVTYVESDSPRPTRPGKQCLDIARNLGIGSSGSDVIALQKHLQATGDFRYPEITGYYGEVTAEAVRIFQCREVGVCFGTANSSGYGVVGPRTREALKKACQSDVDSGPITPEAPRPVACTLEYAPICGIKNGVQKTYGNECQLKADNAQTFHFGQCKDAPNEAPASCKVWNDGCNVCTRSTPGGALACTKRACIWQGIPMCEVYFDGQEPITGTHPIIHSFTGPTTLGIGQTGTWKIDASDPQNGSLSYKIDWGDRSFIQDAFGAIQALASDGFVQSTTFTHTYGKAGTYVVTIIARDNQGLQAKTTSTVRVGADVSGSDTSFGVSPQAGVAPLTVTATITLPPRPSNTFEICGPIVVGDIDWGDGSTDRPTRLGCSSQRVVTFSHVYTSPGSYTVTFTDGAGVAHTKHVTVQSGTVANGCVANGVVLPEGTRRACIDGPNGLQQCIDDATFVCRVGNWHIDTSVSNEPEVCVGGGSYGAGYYESCGQTPTSLSVFEPNGGTYRIGDQIRVSWSASSSRSDVGMYLVLEDEATGRRYKSMKVDVNTGSAMFDTGSSCNAFFSDGIDGGCASLRDNSRNGNVRYRIRGGLYTPTNACFGFCAPNSVTPQILMEDPSGTFTLGV